MRQAGRTVGSVHLLGTRDSSWEAAGVCISTYYMYCYMGRGDNSRAVFNWPHHSNSSLLKVHLSNEEFEWCGQWQVAIYTQSLKKGPVSNIHPPPIIASISCKSLKFTPKNAHPIHHVWIQQLVYRPYPWTRNCEITSFTSGWQIAKGGKGALLYSQIAVNDGKERRGFPWRRSDPSSLPSR